MNLLFLLPLVSATLIAARPPGCPAHPPSTRLPTSTPITLTSFTGLPAPTPTTSTPALPPTCTVPAIAFTGLDPELTLQIQHTNPLLPPGLDHTSLAFFPTNAGLAYRPIAGSTSGGIATNVLFRDGGLSLPRVDLNGDGKAETKARLTVPKNRPWNNVLFSELTVYQGGDLKVVGYYGCDSVSGVQQTEIGVSGGSQSRVFCLRQEASDDVGYEYSGWGLSVRPKGQTDNDCYEVKVVVQSGITPL